MGWGQTSVARQDGVGRQAGHCRVLPKDDVADVHHNRVLGKLLKDLPLVEEGPDHPVEVVVLLILRGVVGDLPGKGALMLLQAVWMLT